MNQNMPVTAQLPTTFTEFRQSPDLLLLGCKTMLGQRLKNHHGEVIGELCNIVLDLKTGRISYAVLAFSATITANARLFAVHWHALVLDEDQHNFTVEVERSALQRQAGFDRSCWPVAADQNWQRKVDGFYSSFYSSS